MPFKYISWPFWEWENQQKSHCHNYATLPKIAKAFIATGGNMTETPATNTYASVISWESVCIALTLAALNGLEVKIADIKNAYLTVPFSEKIAMLCLRARVWCQCRETFYCSTVIIWPEEYWCIISESRSRLYAAPRMGVVCCWLRPLDESRD